MSRFDLETLGGREQNIEVGNFGSWEHEKASMRFPFLSRNIPEFTNFAEQASFLSVGFFQINARYKSPNSREHLI